MSQPGNNSILPSPVDFGHGKHNRQSTSGPSPPESVSSWDSVSQEESTALLNGIGEHPDNHRIVYRTDLEKNPWNSKRTVKDRHNVDFRISNVGNSSLRKLKDFWNDQFLKEKDNFFRPMIQGWECMHSISLIRCGLHDNKEDGLQPRVWMTIKPGYWGKNLELSKKVRNGAHAIEQMLLENGFKDIHVDVVECNTQWVS